jgi:hypothetical protein
MLAISGYVIFAGQGPLYFIGSLFALLAEAVWSSRYMNSDRLISGLILYCVFGFLYIGVPVLARHYKKTLRPEFAGAGDSAQHRSTLSWIRPGARSDLGPGAAASAPQCRPVLHAAASRMPILRFRHCSLGHS